SPSTPGMPWGPVSPCGPWGPVSPWGPAGPGWASCLRRPGARWRGLTAFLAMWRGFTVWAAMCLGLTAFLLICLLPTNHEAVAESDCGLGEVAGLHALGGDVLGPDRVLLDRLAAHQQ